MNTNVRQAQVPLTPDEAKVVDLATEREQRLAGPGRRVVKQRFYAELLVLGAKAKLSEVLESEAVGS